MAATIQNKILRCPCQPGSILSETVLGLICSLSDFTASVICYLAWRNGRSYHASATSNRSCVTADAVPTVSRSDTVLRPGRRVHAINSKCVVGNNTSDDDGCAHLDAAWLRSDGSQSAGLALMQASDSGKSGRTSAHFQRRRSGQFPTSWETAAYGFAATVPVFRPTRAAGLAARAEKESSFAVQPPQGQSPSCLRNC